jgi:hypothetical protein
MHLIRVAPLGRLQYDIFVLVQTGFAETTAQIISWLRTTYPYMTRQNMGGAITRLIERGLIERTKRGTYQCCD